MSKDKNQNPEQIALDKIDMMLKEAGWIVQSKNEVDFGAGRGVALSLLLPENHRIRVNF
jgi:type I restriction enzyme R subunit